MHTKWWWWHHHLRKSIWKESLRRWHQWEVIESMHRHSLFLSHYWRSGARSHRLGFTWRGSHRLVHHRREVHILIALRSLHCLVGWATLTLHRSWGSWVLMLMFLSGALFAGCFGWMDASLLVGAVRYRGLLFKCGTIWMHLQLNLIINNKIASPPYNK